MLQSYFINNLLEISRNKNLTKPQEDLFLTKNEFIINNVNPLISMEFVKIDSDSHSVNFFETFLKNGFIIDLVSMREFCRNLIIHQDMFIETTLKYKLYKEDNQFKYEDVYYGSKLLFSSLFFKTEVVQNWDALNLIVVSKLDGLVSFDGCFAVLRKFTYEKNIDLDLAMLLPTEVKFCESQ